MFRRPPSSASRTQSVASSKTAARVSCRLQGGLRAGFVVQRVPPPGLIESGGIFIIPFQSQSIGGKSSFTTPMTNPN